MKEPRKYVNNIGTKSIIRNRLLNKRELSQLPVFFKQVPFLCLIPREKGITTLINIQYWIFHHIVIETCFKMLKSSEHRKLRRYKSPQFLDCSEVF